MTGDEMYGQDATSSGEDRPHRTDDREPLDATSGDGADGPETIDDDLLSLGAHEIEECLRLLETIWPDEDGTGAEPAPRRLGRFAILRELGRGGFGVVFLAEDTLLGRKVALKVPRLEFLSHPEAWARFQREARAASRVDHPNLVPLLEVGAQGPVGYIISAFVPGPSLDHWIKQRRTGAPPRWAARMVATLARAIEHVHQQGILHRDLKPANVLMHAPGIEIDPAVPASWERVPIESWTPRICDFGLAKLQDLDALDTRSRVACGSPSYMAPEQAEARHGKTGPATDVYGLGAILYKMLTGRPPFRGETDLDTLRRVVEDDPVPPRARRPDVPHDLQTICLKCLAKRPERRYATAADLADDLERFLQGRPIAARPVRAWERVGRWTRRNPAAAALAFAVLLIVLAVQGGLIWVNAVLGRMNEQLRVAREVDRVRANELLGQRNLAEDQARLLRRQLAHHRLLEAQQAANSKELEQAQRLLDATGSEPGFTGGGGFAFSYLRRFVRDRFLALDGHKALITAVAVSPDGRTLASGDEAGSVRLWDIASGTCRATIAPEGGWIWRLAFSPDGRSLVSIPSRFGPITVWDVETVRVRGQVVGKGRARAASLFFHEDGRRLTVVRGQAQSTLPPMDTWDLTRETPGLFSEVGPDEAARIAEELTDPRLRAMAALMEAGAPLSSGGSAVLDRSWLERPPRGVASTEDGALGLVAHGDGSFAVYRLSDGLRLAIGRAGAVRDTLVLFDPSIYEKRTDEAERGRLQHLADASSHPSLERPGRAMLVRHMEVTEPAEFDPDGGVLAAWDETGDRLDLVDLGQGGRSTPFDGSPLDNQHAMSFTPDGKGVVMGGTDGIVRLCRLQAPANPKLVAGHSPTEAWALVFAPDGRTIASAGDDWRIRLWEASTGRSQQVLEYHDSLVTSLAFSPDGRMLVSGSFDNRARVVLWDMQTMSRRRTLRGHEQVVRAVALSPDGHTVASGGDDHYLILWDAESGERKSTIPLEARTFAMAFSPDGRILASGGQDRRIILTDTASEGTRSIQAPEQVFALAFSRDGRLLISGHVGGSVDGWDVATGQKVMALPGHGRDIRGLAISPDGQALATASDDRTVRLWDLVTGQEVLVLTDCLARVNAVAFSPDGMTLAAADHSGALAIWDAHPKP